MKKYYIYHIKGKKWGCTSRSVKRRVYEQGYTLDDVCEIIEVFDKKEASDLEDSLNIKYGYKRDPNKYDERNYSEMGKSANLTYEQRSKGGRNATPNLIKWTKNNNAKRFKENPELLKNWIKGGQLCNEKRKKIVLQFDLKGNLIKEWPSRASVYTEMKIHIHHALKNKAKTAGGYVWKYKS
jgi:hypothetical protein